MRFCACNDCEWCGYDEEEVLPSPVTTAVYPDQPLQSFDTPSEPFFPGLVPAKTTTLGGKIFFYLLYSYIVILCIVGIYSTIGCIIHSITQTYSSFVDVANLIITLDLVRNWLIFFASIILRYLGSSCSAIFGFLFSVITNPLRITHYLPLSTRERILFPLLGLAVVALWWVENMHARNFHHPAFEHLW
jgi:hypothetical protein